MKAELYLPKIIGAIIIMIIWVFVAIWVYKAVLYAFKKFKIMQLIDKLNIAYNKDWIQKKETTHKKISERIKVNEIVAKAFAYYFVLVFFRLAITAIGIEEIETFLWELIRYLPSVFIAVIIGFLGIRFANFVYSVVYHALSISRQEAAKIVASWSKIIILFFTLMAVLNRIWIANEITHTILIGFISMLSLAGWLAFWLWWKDIAKEILESFKK